MTIRTTILTIFIIVLSIFISCSKQTENRKYHKLTGDQQGYAYQDDALFWHLFILNSTGTYDYTTSTTTPSYDASSSVDFSPSSDNVSNYSEAVENGMTESTGTDEGGHDSSNDSDGSGMSEDSGSDSGGSDSSSDSGSFDSGSSDGGGSDGGGGE